MPGRTPGKGCIPPPGNLSPVALRLPGLLDIGPTIDAGP